MSSRMQSQAITSRRNNAKPWQPYTAAPITRNEALHIKTPLPHDLARTTRLATAEAASNKMHCGNRTPAKRNRWASVWPYQTLIVRLPSSRPISPFLAHRSQR